MAACILTGDRSARLMVPVTREPGTTFIGHVGRSLSDQGMQVCLNILEKDQQIFEIYTEIAVTNPAHPDRGIVRVGDDGLICWHCTMRLLGGSEDGVDLDDVASTLSLTLATVYASR